jgi:hypothetical protein
VKEVSVTTPLHVNAEAGRPAATMTEIVEGPVPAADRIYALDQIHSICRAAPRAVQRARVRLCVQPHPIGDAPAAADCLLLVDGALIICAGSAASSMREAIDGLAARLLLRVPPLDFLAVDGGLTYKEMTALTEQLSTGHRHIAPRDGSDQPEGE